MTQASLASGFETQFQSAHSQHVEPGSAPPNLGLTLWLLGLTAMVLGFASLLLVGLVIRGAILDSSERVVIVVYTAIVAGTALVALTYVYAMGRRYGVFRPGDDGVEEPERAATDGLVVASTLPPRTPAPTRKRPQPVHRTRSQQARAIWAVAAEQQLGSDESQRSERLTTRSERLTTSPTGPVGPPAATARTAFVQRWAVPPTPGRIEAVALQLNVVGHREPPWGQPIAPMFVEPYRRPAPARAISPTAPYPAASPGSHHLVRTSAAPGQQPGRQVVPVRPKSSVPAVRR